MPAAVAAAVRKLQLKKERQQKIEAGRHASELSKEHWAALADDEKELTKKRKKR